jgi:hypothetical protein
LGGARLHPGGLAARVLDGEGGCRGGVLVARGCASVSLWRGFLAVKGFGGRLGGARLDATELAARVVDGEGGWGCGWVARGDAPGIGR